MTDTLVEFYAGKTIFITGAAGFLGAFLLDVLLRCCPDIVCIYILLRPKKGIQPPERKELIFKKRILRDISPELKDKVRTIEGDISKPKLGMNDDDWRKVCDEVSVVFHGAACISFTKPYRIISLQNAKGTDFVIELCRKLKNLEALVYTSTAYSNCNRYPEIIKEKVYQLPFKAQKFLDEMENGTDESFDELVNSINSKWPNSYTFSKCLSENILYEKASDLPVAIVRPSIVICSWKGTLPGAMDPGSGLADLSTGVGKGFVRVIHGDNDTLFDLVPADTVVNTHVIAAWCVATSRLPSMHVIHSTAGDQLKLKFGRYMSDMIDITRKNPLPKSFQEMDVKVVKSKLIYRILTLYQHYVPAVVLDMYLRCKGSKLRLFKLYRFFDRMMEQLNHFTSTSFIFLNDNYHDLPKLLQPQEREMFYTEINTTFYDIVSSIPTGSEIFNWELDEMTQKKRLNFVLMQTMVITFIKRSILLLFLILLYVIISKLFSV